MRTIRTVLGDIGPGDLGLCDAHDHLFLRSPVLPGQELDDVAAAERELTAFRDAGGRSVVQWTPYGMGRCLPALIELSRATGVHVVAATGLHQARHYDPDLLAGLDLTDLFVGELREGLVGLIKVAGSFHVLDAHARRTMTAAAEASLETGAPVAVHLEAGTAVGETLDVLCGEAGLPTDRVILGHLNRNPDSVTHLDAARAGAYLAFDGPSRANHATDWRLMDCLRVLTEAGHADQVLLGGDTVVASARSSADGPGMPYLSRVLAERVRRELGADVASRMLEHNPARAFATR